MQEKTERTRKEQKEGHLTDETEIELKTKSVRRK